MTFYQELQLNQAGSKKLISESNSTKGKCYHEGVFLFKIILTVALDVYKRQGLVRKEKYELPPEAIREMIINAHCHRNLLDESCIQVAVYDDRLEAVSYTHLDVYKRQL